MRFQVRKLAVVWAHSQHFMTPRIPALMPSHLQALSPPWRSPHGACEMLMRCDCLL